MAREKTVTMSQAELEIIWNALDAYSLELLSRGAKISDLKDVRRLAAGFRDLRYPKWRRDAAKGAFTASV